MIRQRAVDYHLRLAQDIAQMVFTAETLRVDFVNVLSAGRPCSEPAAGGNYLQTADGYAVAWRAVEHAVDLLAAQLRDLYLLRREF